MLPAAAAFGQDWPLPASTPNTDVPCSTCVGKETLKTIGYPPVLGFVGRFVDSEISPEYQFPFRTVRARGVGFAPAPANRVYMMIGSAVAAYDTDTFFARETAHETPVYATSIPVAGGMYRNFAVERFLWWDRFFYAEAGGGWILPGGDGQDRLYGIDWDDRGLVYLAYSVYGWGIVRDDFGKGGSWMANLSDPPNQVQVLPGLGDVSPFYIVSCKTTDGGYYVVVSSGGDNKAEVWNVSDPRNPIRQSDQFGRDFRTFTKDPNGSRVATVNGNGQLKIYSTDAFVRGGTPTASFVLSGGSYNSITTDGTNFYALGSIAGAPYISVINGTTYAETRIPVLEAPGKSVSYATPGGIRAGAGFLAVWGIENGAGGWNIRLYKIGNGGALSEVPLDNYFAKYYSGGSPPGYAHPSFSAFMDVAPVKHGTKTYLVVESFGLGDVYEIKAGDSLTARLLSTAVPFYGDTQTYTSALSSNAPVGVNWTFDDNTSGHTIAGSPQITHQFGGATRATDLPMTRHATATNENDSTMTDTTAVTLAKPTVRFKLGGTSYLFLQPDASSTVPIVTSDSFIDGSDGSVEGHYSEWVLDSGSTKKLPSETFPVGACGAHTLNFLGHYGPYAGTGAGIASVGSDLPLAINGFFYASRPFAVAVQPPPPIVGTATGPAVFTASVRATSTAADLPAGLSTPVTYLWEVVGSSGTTLQSQGGSEKTLGSIPTYSVARSVFNTLGSKVRLTVTAAASAVSGACAPYRVTASATDPLNAPDPTIVTTGCVNAGSLCSFSITSSGSQSGWTYAWSLKDSNAVGIASSNASTFAPSITTGGTYTVTLVVTNGIGSATVSTPTLTIATPLCPAPIEANTAVGFSGGTSGCFSPIDTCSAGETITFRVFATGWSPAACNTYLWDFGDGTQSIASQPTHQYTNGKYTVKLALTGVAVTANITTSVTVGTTVLPPPPPPPTGGTCASLTQQSAYIGFGGSSSGCTGIFGACNPAESIAFTLYPQNGYNLNCGSTTFQWSFSDGVSGTGQNFTHAFASAGLYSASCTVSNTGGQQLFTIPVQVGTVEPKTCGTMTQANVSLTYGGPNCSDAGGDCRPADTITFSAVGKGYDFSCNTHNYQWAFGDGGTSTLASPTHAYATAGPYTAKVTITQGTQHIDLSHAVSVNGSPSGGTGVCPTMYADFNVYVTFLGSATQCATTSGASCNPGESVGFHASGYQYDYACDTHTFAWDFGDGGHATGQSPPHTYAATGTYKVTLHLSNKAQLIDLTATVKVGDGVDRSVPPRRRASHH